MKCTESPGSAKATQSRKLTANDPKGKEKVTKKKLPEEPLVK
jgi:hypothetical protein